MLHHLTVVGPAGRPLDPRLVSDIQAGAERALAFEPTHRLRWSDGRGSTAVLAWALEAGDAAEPRGWNVGPSGVTLVAGSAWAIPGHGLTALPQAVELGALLHQGPPAALRGTFTTVAVGPDGRGRLDVDPLGTGLLYRASSHDLVAVASTAALAAEAVHTGPGRPGRDLAGTAWLAVYGQPVGTATGHQGVQALAARPVVRLLPGRDPEVSYRSEAEITAAAEAPTFEEGLELAWSEMLGNVRAAADLPVPTRVDVTGGRDSRLVLAAVVDAGLLGSFRYRTLTTDDADVDVAAALTALLDVELEVEPAPGVGSGDAWFLERLATHVFQTGGQFPGSNLRGDLTVGVTAELTGLGGEFARSFYGDRTQVRTVDDATAFLAARMPDLRGEGVCRPHVVDEHVRALGARLQELSEGGVAAPDVIHAFYVDERMRRWMGLQAEVRSATPRIHGLYSPAGHALARRLGPAGRRDERIAFELMRRAAPALAEAPFADRGWFHAVWADLPDGSRYAATPVHSSRELSGLQGSRLADHVGAMRAILLDDATNPVNDLVDRSAVEAALDRCEAGEQLPEGTVRQLHDVAAAAMWLGHHELERRITA